jgi:hypothetical protein
MKDLGLNMQTLQTLIPESRAGQDPQAQLMQPLNIPGLPEGFNLSNLTDNIPAIIAGGAAIASNNGVEGAGAALAAWGGEKLGLDQSTATVLGTVAGELGRQIMDGEFDVGKLAGAGAAAVGTNWAADQMKKSFGVDIPAPVRALMATTVSGAIQGNVDDNNNTQPAPQNRQQQVFAPAM